MPGPAGQEAVHGNFVPPDDLDERVGTAVDGALDQRAVCLHLSPKPLGSSLTWYCRKTRGRSVLR
jgi:hypothetical protein